MADLESSRDGDTPKADGAGKPKVHTFNCPSCGGIIELRAIGHSVTAACGSCGALVDVNDERYKLIDKVRRVEFIPELPLGTRGHIGDGLYEVIGYLERAEGSFSWDEYLLFNPYLGFRWLVNVEGHWNFVTMLREKVAPAAGQPMIRYRGQDYFCYNRGRAEVTYVLGEFYWRIKAGDTVTGTDYICPPYMLSAEESDDELVWSLGTYVSGTEIRKAFAIQSVAASRGVGANQPSPFATKLVSAWQTAGIALLAVIAVAIGMAFLHSTSDIFRGSISPTAATVKQTNILGSFHIPDASGELSIDTSAGLNNSWAEINYSLVNKATNASYDFTQALEYYSGSDSDGAWTEGSWTGTGDLSAIPGGDYDLVADIAYGDSAAPPTIRFDVKRHPHSWQTFLIAIGLLLIYPLLVSGLQLAFEKNRRSNSDYDSSGVFKVEDNSSDNNDDS